MYELTVILSLFVLPIVFAGIEISSTQSDAGWFLLLQKWTVFWAVGFRLFVAGLRQIKQPMWTLKEIFEITDKKAAPIVRELGFANTSVGTIGLLSVYFKNWAVPAALVGGLYYFLAGWGHFFQAHRNSKENFAMITDFIISFVLGIFVYTAL